MSHSQTPTHVIESRFYQNSSWDYDLHGPCLPPWLSVGSLLLQALHRAGHWRDDDKNVGMDSNFDDSRVNDGAGADIIRTVKLGLALPN